MFPRFVATPVLVCITPPSVAPNQPFIRNSDINNHPTIKTQSIQGRNPALLERLAEIAARSSPLCALVQRFRCFGPLEREWKTRPPPPLVD